MQTPLSSLQPGTAAAGAGTPPAVAPAPRHPPALPVGQRLGGFELQQVLARSTTGIVYLGTDPALDRPVAIKEYLPARLALRDPRGVVHALEPWQEDDFARGLRAFKDEARTLARCDHPSLLRVLQLFEANGTAYRVMPHHAGTRLDELRRAMVTPPDEAALRKLLDALLGALAEYHRVGGAHGAVTPDNILLLADDRPLLLGPGSASHAVASELVEQWLAHLKTAFAPPDAAASASDAPAGIAADLHALAEVARFCITGVTAPNGAQAVHASHGTRATETPRYGEALLRALDAAGSARLQDWPVSVAQFRGWLAEPAVRAPDGEPPPLPDVYLDSDSEAGHSLKMAAGAGLLDDVPRTPAAQAAAARTVHPHPELTRAEPMGTAAHPRARGTADTTLDPEWLAQRLAAARPVHRAARRARLAWLAAGALALVAAILGLGSRLWQIGPPIQVDVPPQFASDSPRLRNEPGDATPAPPPAAVPEKSPAAGARPGATPAAMATPARAPAVTPASVPAQIADDQRTSPATQPDTHPQPSAARPAPPAGKPGTGAVNTPVAPPPTSTTLQDTSAAPAADPSGHADAAEIDAPARERASPSATTNAPESRAARGSSSDRTTPRAAASALATPAAESPREACAGRTEFSLYRCMQTQCSRARWSQHAQCIRLRATDQVD